MPPSVQAKARKEHCSNGTASSCSKASKTLSAICRRQQGQATASHTMKLMVRSHTCAAITCNTDLSKQGCPNKRMASSTTQPRFSQASQKNNRTKQTPHTLQVAEAVKGSINKAPKIFRGPCSRASLEPQPVQSHCTSCPGKLLRGSRAANPAAE